MLLYAWSSGAGCRLSALFNIQVKTYDEHTVPSLGSAPQLVYSRCMLKWLAPFKNSGLQNSSRLPWVETFLMSLGITAREKVHLCDHHRGRTWKPASDFPGFCLWISFSFWSCFVFFIVIISSPELCYQVGWVILENHWAKEWSWAPSKQS